MENVQSTQEFTPKPEVKTFETRARALVEKFKLANGIPNLERVIQTSKGIAEKYKVPEAFLNDDVNLALLLGCGQKLTEASDPRYLKRPESLAQRLVAPSAEKGTIDVEELWGSEPERTGLNEAQVKEYVKSKADSEATAEFIEKHKGSIARARDIWEARGYDLDINVTIVSDEVYEFRKKTRAGGFINVPSQEELPQGGGQAKIEFVLLKGYSDKDNFVRHELYHVEDYWGFVRRGFQRSVLESLDELHTEYSAGNYREEHSKDPFGDSAYFTLKQFWDDLSYVGDLDFNLIKDRQATVGAIARNFGLDGLVDFTLMYAHGDGKFTIFETFYRDHERPIIEMLISREKLNLRKLESPENLGGLISETTQALGDLQKYMTPPKDYWSPKYKSIYELIPSKEGKVWSASPIAEDKGGTELKNEEAKHVVVAYARALAFAELYHRGEFQGQEAIYQQITEALAQIPHHRTRPDFSIEEHVKKEYTRGKEYSKNDDELYEDIYNTLYNSLVTDMGGIDFAFSLQNPATREQILKPFFNELDLLAKHCIESGKENFMKWFVDGLYRFNMTSELRDSSAQYLAGNYPELKPVVEARRSSFDARKVANFSF